MKILVITNLYPPHEIGGYELRCRDICTRLAARGHDIHILTSTHKVPGRPQPDEPQIHRRLEIHGMYGHPWLPILKVREQVARNHRVLRETIASVKPDLIHVWNMGGISKSLLVELEKGPVTLVYDISDHWIARSIRADVWLKWWNGPNSLPGRLIRTALSLAGIRKVIDRTSPTGSWDLLRFPHIYFCSAFMRDLSAGKNWPVSHGAVIHCGIETHSFAVKADHSGFTRLLWVGRLAEDKDPLTAVRGLAAAHRHGLTHLTLDLFGKGDEAYVAMLRQEVADLGLGNHVSFNLATPEEMKSLYAEYDSLLFTSNWGEPFSLTPLEAMASGLPVITTTDGGQKELARDGVNSLVAGAADPDSFGGAILKMSASPELRRSMAATSLEEARARFDVEHITAEIEAFLISASRK